MPLRFLMIHKEKSEKTVDIHEVIFYLKSMYSTNNDEPSQNMSRKMKI